MKQYFETMKALAIDPCLGDDAAIARAHDLAPADVARLRLTPEAADIRDIAGDDWASCEACWDPGSDFDPFPPAAMQEVKNSAGVRDTVRPQTRAEESRTDC